MIYIKRELKFKMCVRLFGIIKRKELCPAKLNYTFEQLGFKAMEGRQYLNGDDTGYLFSETKEIKKNSSEQKKIMTN